MMKNAVAAEFLKLRRSRVLPLLFLTGAAPSVVKLLRALLAPPAGGTSWRTFLASGQELAVFGLLIAVMLVANHIFTMEYRFHTAAAVFTSKTGRGAVFLAKILCLCALVLGTLLLSSVSQLLLGLIAADGALDGELLSQFLKVTLWYAGSFLLLAVVAALPAVLFRRFVPAAVVTLSYYILTFPFHTKSLYGCFFMTPVAAAAKIYGSVDYIFAFDYQNLPATVPQAAALVIGLGLAAFLIGIFYYRRAETPR